MSKVTAMNANTMKTNLQKPTLVSANFAAETKQSEQPTTNNKPSKADELAQHSHHHTALFLRVGAGGKGRSAEANLKKSRSICLNHKCEKQKEARPSTNKHNT